MDNSLEIQFRCCSEADQFLNHACVGLRKDFLPIFFISAQKSPGLISMLQTDVDIMDICLAATAKASIRSFDFIFD
jgi:hypothetical protein